MKHRTAFLLIFLLAILQARAQSKIDEGQTGVWYMAFLNKQFDNTSFGVQGDYQFRYWDTTSDREQILLRTGLTFTPKDAGVMFTWGYAHISTGDFGESTASFPENRMYQEALIPHKIGGRFYLTHRYRYEQRWVEGQDFRTRYRYNLFLNVPINGTALAKNIFYLALYNEIFINGERNIGEGRSVALFDRNRTYLGAGYGLRDNLRVQLGWMLQTTDAWAKGQLQVSLHQNW